jgi:hypothetical protein
MMIPAASLLVDPAKKQVLNQLFAFVNHKQAAPHYKYFCCKSVPGFPHSQNQLRK